MCVFAHGFFSRVCAHLVYSLDTRALVGRVRCARVMALATSRRRRRFHSFPQSILVRSESLALLLYNKVYYNKVRAYSRWLVLPVHAERVFVFSCTRIIYCAYTCIVRMLCLCVLFLSPPPHAVSMLTHRVCVCVCVDIINVQP